ncbi:MAG: chromosome segregation protein SMC [Proteobacteria bacterium]|nr:chromosome segregation protein SMC [Pseudomonadota bacterium]
MRLTKIKLAGFKSFVDPTQVNFPSNLTGVVGPNGCGKSNVIDAVRWVMGELSAKHLRGDNMADVVFNGSSARKPVGSASVELVFDNSDGKIGGAYASYNEIALRRQVSRDGASGYFINGVRCRRKDITNLFLGTGLGSRSYAIIEQGMISRVIEAKSEDMRAFIEEAAGISRYKERRKETEARVAETRENLERLQDVRDEVEKQIRHLQRQAATARRYQALKEEEHRLGAQLLALRLRELDSGAEVHDAAVRERELAMQAALAGQRSAEAAIERQRGVHALGSENLSAVQGRHYEVGAEISRLQQQIEHTRALRERQRSDLANTMTTLTEVGTLLQRDERELAAVRAELAGLAPQLEQAQHAEHSAAQRLAECEQALQDWQQRWEAHGREAGATDQTVQVEQARIEGLQEQLRQLGARAERLTQEQQSLGIQDADGQLRQLGADEATACGAREQQALALQRSQAQVQEARGEQHAAEEALERARAAREAARAELTSLEALQTAALSDHAGQAGEWLRGAGLHSRPRLAAALEVSDGWERAVETALGDYLEAVCVAGLEEASAALPGLTAGRVTLLEGDTLAANTGRGLAAHVSGPAAAISRLAGVLTAESLQQALQARNTLGEGESLITRDGEWVGRGWLRVSRGADPRAGSIEREHRLKALRGAAEGAQAHAARAESDLTRARERLVRAEAERDAAQAALQSAHAEHAARAGALQAGRARAQESERRVQQLRDDAAEVTRTQMAAQESLARAAAQISSAQGQLEKLAVRYESLGGEREQRREALTGARAGAQQAQLAARDLHVRVESRRTSETSVAVRAARLQEQREQLARRQAELEVELAGGDEPILRAQTALEGSLGRRLALEAELAAARAALEEADAALRALDEQRLGAEQQVNGARDAMEQARLAAQETHVRRAALAEQFAATGCDLPQVLEGLAAEASVPQWEENLAGARADIEKLGSVNLAAIDELQEHSKRKEYLDSQFADLNAALTTLDEAMNRIDKETRTRFEDTFERINVGLREKFPRLFGGGHAYLELVGEDRLTAGVAVMARPPGKKNSTIHLLSGGEKALTAVALVFSIFDLNPAPFCLLDEVDAPLDEHNVGRFCDIVREMSQRVQFLFITHNKTTMELASQLIGVTMNEPGVSRLVTVDVDAAVRLAAV